MEQSWIHRRRLTLLVSLLVLLLAVWGASTPSFQWRTQLVVLKLRGGLRLAGWTDLLFGPNPQGRLWREWKIADAMIQEKSHGGEEPCPVLWETPMGEFWGRESDVYPLGVVVEEQFFRKIYEKGPVRIRTGDVVFDAGSHLGAFTRFALQHGAGLVVAFEPEAINLACYKRTFQQELAAGRIILVEEALWEEPGTLDFTTGQHSGAGSVHPSEGKPDAQLVPATTIDETVARLGLDRLDFIKMDIEGSERHALRGGRQSLARFSPKLAICIYHRPDDREAVPQEVQAALSSYQMETSDQVAYFH
jgi:FkbM family methyltransferase